MIKITTININTLQKVNIEKSNGKQVDDLRDKIIANVKRSLAKYSDVTDVNVGFVLKDGSVEQRASSELIEYKGYQIYNIGNDIDKKPIQVRTIKDPDYKYFQEINFENVEKAKLYVDSITVV